MKTKYMVKKSAIVSLFIYLTFAFLFFLLDYSENINKVLAIFVLGLSVYWIYKCWNNVYLLILSLFIGYSNYSIVVGIYLDPKMRPKYLYPQITDVKVYGIGISLLLLFMFTLVAFTSKIKKTHTESISELFIQEKNHNQFLFFLANCAFVLIILIGYTRGKGTRGNSSPLYEYGTIFLMIMFYFSGNKKYNKIICGIISIIYVLTSLINGTRVEALTCILIFTLCYFRKGIRQWVIFCGMIMGLVVFSIVGTLRGNWQLLSGNVFLIASEIFKSKFVFDTCTHAYFPMLCMIDVFKECVISKRIYYLGCFMATVFMGQSRVTDGDLIRVVAEKYYHNYGGVTVGFFYVWFEYLGPLIYAVIVTAYIKFITNINTKLSQYKLCTLLYIVTTVPRWFLYGPWPLFRGVMICMIVFWFFNKVDSVIRIGRGVG